MHSQLERFKPGVGKRVLLLLSGLMWMGVGVMLVILAYGWLTAKGGTIALVLGVIGLAASLVIHHFGFLKIVDKNLARILPMEGKRCLFSFQPWRSYFLILVMVGMGIGLRHSPLPKHYLAVIYTSIGMALILSSIRYLKVFITRQDVSAK